MLPQISETGLFHNTDQMGATASSSGSLFRGIEGSYSSGTVHDARLRDLMNSLANGNVGVDLMACGGESEAFRRVCTGGGRVEEGGLMGGDEPKLQQGLPMESISGSSGFTRDFLGIGSMVRDMISQRDQNGGTDFLPFDSESTSASSSRPFPARGWE